MPTSASFGENVEHDVGIERQHNPTVLQGCPPPRHDEFQPPNVGGNATIPNWVHPNIPFTMTPLDGPS
jgi:hypothetical protein